MTYESRKEQRNVNETMSSLLIPLKNSCTENVCECIDITLRILAETDVDDEMTDAHESHAACKEGECAVEHRQLATWMKELKGLRTKDAQIKDAINRFEMQKLAQDEISSFEYAVLKAYGVME